MKIYKKASDCYTVLQASASDSLRDSIRSAFSNDFIECCAKIVMDMHEELSYRLRPLVESAHEHSFSEMDWEGRHNPHGVVMTTVWDISKYLRSSCSQLVK